MKQRAPTIFLKTVIVLIGITSLIFGIFLLPKFANAMSVFVPAAAFFKLPFLICMYAAMIIFFFALYQAIRLLHYIDNGKVFSDAEKDENSGNADDCAFLFGWYAGRIPCGTNGGRTWSCHHRLWHGFHAAYRCNLRGCSSKIAAGSDHHQI